MKTHEKIIIGAYSIVLTVSVILGSIWWYKYTSAKRRLDELGRLSEQYREQITGAESAFESAKEENRRAAEITGELTELNDRNIKSVSDARLTLQEIREQVELLEKVYNSSSVN